jgi:hypothetical protein
VNSSFAVQPLGLLDHFAQRKQLSRMDLIEIVVWWMIKSGDENHA